MPPAAVVFDMDGLLIDTEGLYKAAWQQAARELGVDLTDEFYKTLIGRSNPEGEVILAKQFGAALPLDRFRSRWAELWRTRVQTSGMPLKPGVMEMLDFLEGHGVPVALATSSDRVFTAFSLESAGLAARLTRRVTGDEIRHGKPEPDIYLEAARRLGVNAATCVAFEDSEAGVISAARAGMRVVMVPDLQSPSSVAKEAAAAVVTTLHDALPLLTSWLTR